MRALILTLVACGNGAPAGTGARDQVVALWKQAGLDVSSFVAANNGVGSDCVVGTVAKVDVLLCNYATADAATHAADNALQWIGDTTGSSQARGTLVIAAADRHKVDPNGRTINQIFEVVPK